MKTYNAPKLVVVGSVVERTQGTLVADSDPGQNEIQKPIGSVGFSL